MQNKQRCKWCNLKNEKYIKYHDEEWGITLLSYFSKEKVRVTICCTESTLLTQKPKIPGITVFVQYEDTIPVENLWRICYTLENTGNRNIIGEGAQSSLVADFHYIRKM